MGEIDDIITEISPNYASKKKKEKDIPDSQHQLIYDSSSETLEPIYFWILDFMNNMFQGDVTKLVDNFSSSPGSGHFSELGGKVTAMQQQAMNVMGTVNQILKAVINLIYDLKEFQIRLDQYDEANSEDKTKAEAGMLALKQVWMDQVDSKRGNGSINMLATTQLNFVTLRDAFMIGKSVEDVDKMDLNERVKNILKPRLQDFYNWRDRSEKELKKRFEVEKAYLKSQVNTLKLYTQWAKPYLKAAQTLEMSPELEGNPALVTVFNTLMMQLTIIGKASVNIDDEAVAGNLPKTFKKMKLRKHHPVVIVDFNFRGIPTKTGQHYTFGGRAEVTFKAYSLNEEEIKLFKYKQKKSDLNDALKLIQGMTDDSLAQLNDDIEYYIGDAEGEEKEEKKTDNTNPFSALFSGILKSKKKDKPKKEKTSEEKEEEEGKALEEKGVKPDNHAEKYVRNLAEAMAITSCFTIFDIYKKAHGMAAFPYKTEVEEPTVKAPTSETEKWFGFR